MSTRHDGPVKCPPVAGLLAAIAVLTLAAGCSEGQNPTGNPHLEDLPPNFPDYVQGEVRLEIRGAEMGTYGQSGWFFLEEGVTDGPASKQWGGYYSNSRRAQNQVDTLVQLLGWGPLPEGRHPIQPVLPTTSRETAAFAALEPFLYAHPVSFTLVPMNFHQPDAPLVYVTSDGSYIQFETIDLPDVDPLLKRGVGGQIQARLRLRMRGYRPVRTDRGTTFFETNSYIEILGSLDLSVVRDDLGGEDSGGAIAARGSARPAPFPARPLDAGWYP